MIRNIKNVNKFKKFICIFYLILILGFYLGEDLNGNAKEDYLRSISYNKSICTKFFYTFDNYSSLEEGTSRQSPIFFF